MTTACSVMLATLAVAPQFQAVRDPAPVALERRLAERLGASAGDTIRIALEAGGAERLAVVAAVYEPKPDPATVTRRDLALRFHLPDLAALLGTPDRVNRFGIALQPGVPPDSAAARLNRVAFGFRAAASAAIAGESSQTFRVVSRFHSAIAVISVGASAIFLLCIMLLKVEERRRDAAVMRFIGVRPRTIFIALLLEALLVAGLGSVLGVLLAAAAALVTNWYYQGLFDTALIFASITPGILRFSILLSLALGVGAGALAARRLVRTNPHVLWGRG
jgi:putative ABC transport system permease protein